jgi:hypothetical protein
MPWERYNDGLILKGKPHFCEDDIENRIDSLAGARNQPATVCSELRELLKTGIASRKLIWRLSKWCHWDDWSANEACSIAEKFFHGIVCRRLLDERNKPIPDTAIAEADYQLWLNRVIEASDASAGNK